MCAAGKKCRTYQQSGSACKAQAQPTQQARPPGRQPRRGAGLAPSEGGPASGSENWPGCKQPGPTPWSVPAPAAGPGVGGRRGAHGCKEGALSPGDPRPQLWGRRRTRAPTPPRRAGSRPRASGTPPAPGLARAIRGAGGGAAGARPAAGLRLARGGVRGVGYAASSRPSSPTRAAPNRRPRGAGSIWRARARLGDARQVRRKSMSSRGRPKTHFEVRSEAAPLGQ